LTRSRSARPGLVVICRRTAGRIIALSVAGHAGFAPYGRDIVCAAVSALVLSAAHGVRKHCGVRTRVVDLAGDGFELTIPRRSNARAQAVLETTVSGLRAIERAYPGRLRLRMVAGKLAGAPKRSGPRRPARD
jgi:uncharacterized protein